MSAELTEQQMVRKAENYLKDHYGEDTIRMDVLDNDVEDGDGALTVECTVSIGGSLSDWRKVFTFKNGNVTNMSWRRL